MARKKKKSFMTPKASRRKARKRLSTTSGRVKKEFTYRGYTVEELSTHVACGLLKTHPPHP